MITRFHLVIAAALLVGEASAIAGPQQSSPIRSTFEGLAKEITILGRAEFIYGFRDSQRIPPEELRRIKQFTDLLESGIWKASDFLPLLKHDDPKVRTLALIALYSLDDPNVLPDVFSLLNDEAGTFRAMMPFTSIYFEGLTSPIQTEPQTVGQIATTILDTYMKSSGYSYGPLGSGDEPGFEAYWKAHAGRSYSAGWWIVRLARAGHATLPTPVDRYSAIKELRTQIDRLPDPDRTLTLLRLIDELGADVLVSREELKELLRGLGPTFNLGVLQRKIPTDDPDLRPDRGVYSGMRLFILQHSDALLRPGDAAALLDQEAWERDFQKNGITDPLIDPLWAIGAAQLNRAEASAILEQAYGRFQGQYDSRHQLELAHALWRLAGEGRTAMVADWIYAELAKPMGSESSMLQAILKQEGRRNTVLGMALIEDRRFDELNWKSIEVLSRSVNTWTGREVVLEREMEGASSPIGIDFFMRDKDKGLVEYPKQIGELAETLARWRQSLRASVTTLRSLR